MLNSSMGDKKIPMRICLGCNEAKNKSELYRIVKQSDGSIVVDKTGKINGRGAYICKNPECLEKAFKTGGLMRSFKMKISNEIMDSLKEELVNDR